MKNGVFSQDQLMIMMTRPSKQKIQYKKQKQSDNGRFIKKSQLTDGSEDNDDSWRDDDDSLLSMIPRR